MKEVNNEKYLGDYISTLGSADSALVTVTKRHQKVMTYVYEIKAVIEDCRAEVVGGITAGLEIWELAVLPYLINKCDTWAYMPKQVLDIFFRTNS